MIAYDTDAILFAAALGGVDASASKAQRILRVVHVRKRFQRIYVEASPEGWLPQGLGRKARTPQLPVRLDDCDRQAPLHVRSRRPYACMSSALRGA